MESLTPHLSIIIPVLNEEFNLEPLTKRVKEVLDPMNFEYEVIFIDDGSTDNTLSAIKQHQENDNRFKGVSLKRNFGKSEAYMVGFEIAKGDYIATMDGDMQDDPEDILKLLEEVKKGSDLVIGWKKTGKSSRSTFFLSRLFNSGIRWITGSTLHDLNCPLRVMKKEVAKSLDIYASLHRYIPILVASQGFKVSETIVGNYERLHGKSNYKFSKYLESLFDLMTVLFVTFYRRKPLQFLGPIGLSSFILGFGIDAYYCFLGLTGIERMRNNIPSLLLGIALIMIGVQIILTGLMGEMITRELNADKKHHTRSIREIVGI